MLADTGSGVGPLASRDSLLPVTRMIIVFLMVGSFALFFAELVRHSEQMSVRSQPSASRCGDAAGMPCPQRAL
jgi:hypothetical protein